MRHAPRLGACLVPVLAFALAGAPPAHATGSFDTCDDFITILPADVPAGKTACLAQDVVHGPLDPDFDKQHITLWIHPGATLDCHGHSLATRHNVSIYAPDGGITVRNCVFRWSGRGGGALVLGNDNLIEDSVFEDYMQALQFRGSQSILRRNVFRFRDPTRYATGAPIVTSGAVVVQDNLIDGVPAAPASNGSVIGIDVFAGEGAVVERNRIRGLIPDGTGTATGIRVVAPQRTLVRDNRIVGPGGAASRGVACVSTKVRASDNIAVGVAQGIPGCGDGGGNDASP